MKSKSSVLSTRGSGGSFDEIDERVGTALDSLLSTNELARLARREMDALRDFVTASVASVDRPDER